MNILRCSSLERFFKCNWFLNYPDAQICTSKYAQAGTDLHLDAEIAFNEDLKGSPEVFNYLEYIRSFKKESSYCNAENKIMVNVNHNFKLSGTIDFLNIDKNGNAIIVDLKTGVMEVSPLSLQMFGYALLVKKHFKDVKNITVVIHQNDIAKKLDVTPYLPQFEEDLKMAVKRERKAVLGEHCTWCNALLECSKVQKLMENVINEI